MGLHLFAEDVTDALLIFEVGQEHHPGIFIVLCMFVLEYWSWSSAMENDIKQVPRIQVWSSAHIQKGLRFPVVSYLLRRFLPALGGSGHMVLYAMLAS